MGIRVGIVEISAFGGADAMRLIASHPSFDLVHAAGEGSAGSRLVNCFPGVPAKRAETVRRSIPDLIASLDRSIAAAETTLTGPMSDREVHLRSVRVDAELSRREIDRAAAYRPAAPSPGI